MPERPAPGDFTVLFFSPAGPAWTRGCGAGCDPVPFFCFFFIFIAISFHLSFPAGNAQAGLFRVMEIENRKLFPALAAPYCRNLWSFSHRGTRPGIRRIDLLHARGLWRNSALLPVRGKASLGNSRLPFVPLRIQRSHGFVQVPDLFVMDSVGCKNFSHPPGAVTQCGLLPYLFVGSATI